MTGTRDGRRLARVALCGVALLLVAGAAVLPARAAEPGATARISFQSLTLPPTELGVFNAGGTPTAIWGDLQLPPNAPPRAPAVVLLHGAGGITPNLAEWAAEVHRLGMASFVVDSFTPRGIRETRTGAASINIATRVVDAYRALELLAAHPRIDPEGIAVMGFSQGGGVVLLARQPRLQRLWAQGDRRFAAALAFYPSLCNLRLIDDETATGPLRLFHGTADDQTIIGPCREYVARMGAAGQDVALHEYAGAHHGFDLRDARGVPQPHVLSARNCVYVERAPGRIEVTHREGGRPASAADPCATRGITVAYDPAGHRQAIADVRHLLMHALGAR